MKKKQDIVETISKFVALKKSGKSFKGLCPFHGEKTPSFMVHPEKQMYYCFGCKNGGNVIDFLVAMANKLLREKK